MVEEEELEEVAPNEDLQGTPPESNLELKQPPKQPAPVPSDSLELGTVQGYVLEGMGFPHTPNG